MRFFIIAVATLFMSLALTACGDNNSSDNNSSDNTAPVADAGADQNVSLNDIVTLDGSASYDADADVIEYLWVIADSPAGSNATLSDITAVNPTFTVDVEGDYIIDLIVNDGTNDSPTDSVTVSTQFVAPTGYTAVNFTIDDSANQTYEDIDGLAWKGSFSHDPTTRILTYDGAWSGPYVVLYDDGPWTAGGHEPEGSTAGDHIWGITVWVNNSTSTDLEYGAISGSVGGSDGTWIWQGANGAVTIPAAATTAIDATGLTITAHGTIDMRLTIDISLNGSNLSPSFQGADYSDAVQVKGSALGWNTLDMTDDGTQGDVTAGDGIYTFDLSENLGKHDGLLYSGDTPEFVFVLGGVEYRETSVASTSGVSAYTSSGSWASQSVQVQSSGGLNTYITVP